MKVFKLFQIPPKKKKKKKKQTKNKQTNQVKNIYILICKFVF